MASEIFDCAHCNRRGFLGGSLAATGVLLPATAVAAVVEEPVARQASFYNTHTGESLSALYWQQGHYVAGKLTEINYVLRDFRTGDVHPIDPHLVDLVHRLRLAMAYDGPVHVISGYRSPTTNAMLARRSSKVAKNSYHMKGMAIDLRLPGRRLEEVRAAALSLGGGGVGFYPGPQFVHIDTGPVRTW